MEEETQPLWLPKGSVRALMALAVTGSIVYMAVSNVAYEMPEWMIALVSTIAGYYFGERTAQ